MPTTTQQMYQPLLERIRGSAPSLSNPLTLIPFLFSVCLLLVAIRFRTWLYGKQVNRNSLLLPPGPAPWPVIGNIFDLALDDEAAAYNRMATKYGEIFFLSVLGQNILFVNSFKAAYDLFEKKSSIYSDRKRSIMINELQDWDWSFGHMAYGENWKAHRKVFHSEFQQSSVGSYAFVHLKEAKDLACRLLRSPGNLRDHLRMNAAGVIMGVTYGIEDEGEKERFLTVAEKALDGMATAAKPGAFLVDLLPLLRYTPEWFPGAGFLRKAKEWRKAVHEMRDSPFETVKHLIEKGTAPFSFVSNLMSTLDQKTDTKAKEDIIRNCAGLAYAAGAESTISALSTFFLAMVLYPQVMETAHKEIDEVLGHGRLPNETDRERLPYIEAIVKEVLRWNPVTPLGLPHMLSEDDEYNGYFIPTGTVVVGNTWTILHDPVVFPEPHEFKPERFLSSLSSKANPGRLLSLHSPASSLSSGFGYGRRACPGRFLVDQQLFITFAIILSLFEIGPGLDENGRPKRRGGPMFSSGMICHPLPFDCSIKPRGEYVKALLESV